MSWWFRWYKTTYIDGITFSSKRNKQKYTRFSLLHFHLLITMLALEQVVTNFTKPALQYHFPTPHVSAQCCPQITDSAVWRAWDALGMHEAQAGAAGQHAAHDALNRRSSPQAFPSKKEQVGMTHCTESICLFEPRKFAHSQPWFPRV